MTFYRGQKVACVDMSNPGLLGYGDEVMPTQGEVYTVRDIVTDHFGVVGILLDEIRNDVLPYQLGAKRVDFEKCFRASRFEPVVGVTRYAELEAV
ncbi:MAG: hypothetical protein ACAH27_05580 [Xanthobacteraceae bacterium]